MSAGGCARPRLAVAELPNLNRPHVKKSMINIFHFGDILFN